MLFGNTAKCLLSPTVKIHLFRTYICPIARSGLAAMTLRPTHLKSITAFHKKILRGFLHLSDRSPIPSLYFLTGELPIEARIHRDIFSVFYSICQNQKFTALSDIYWKTVQKIATLGPDTY